MRIVGLNTNCYHGYSIEDALKGAANAGFKFIELTATKGWTEHVFPDQSFSRLLSVRELLNDLDLTAFSMSGHTNLMDDERLPDFRMNMQLANFYGCSYIVSSIGEAHLEDRVESANDIIVRNIRSLLPSLEELGLVLVLETHGAHCSKELSEIVEAVDSPFVKMNYDTANVIFYAGIRPEEDIKTCLKDVGYFHLKDKAGGEREWNFPALGDGYIDFPSIFDFLKESGDCSPFSVEIEFTPEGAGSLEEVNKAVRKSYDYLHKHKIV